MIDTNPDNAYGPFGSTSRTAGPKRIEEDRAMHDNPRATEEEQELAQTDRMQEEEEQRGGRPTPEVAGGDEDEE
jgi:hypothetical protein